MAKRQDLTIAKKLDIIEAIEKAEQFGKANYTLIARELKTNRTTVSRISSNRQEIRNSASGVKPSLKRHRAFKEQDVDAALYVWFQQKLQQNCRLNNPILIAKASDLAKEMD